MNEDALKPYITTPENAAKIADWLATRGGIAIWLSVDLSNPGKTLTTPVNTSTGEPSAPPAWWVGKAPACIVTDPAVVVVSEDVEVKRFHVALRMGDQGFKVKCSDGATRRIRAAVAKAGEGSYHAFDYGSQEAVIMKPLRSLPLIEWLAEPKIDTGTAPALRHESHGSTD